MNDELLTLVELGHRLGVQPKALRQLVKLGEIPCVRIGRRPFFSLAAVRQKLLSMAAMPAGVEAHHG